MYVKLNNMFCYNNNLINDHFLIDTNRKTATALAREICRNERRCPHAVRRMYRMLQTPGSKSAVPSAQQYEQMIRKMNNTTAVVTMVQDRRPKTNTK